MLGPGHLERFVIERYVERVALPVQDPVAQPETIGQKLCDAAVRFSQIEPRYATAELGCEVTGFARTSERWFE